MLRQRGAENFEGALYRFVTGLNAKDMAVGLRGAREETGT
jgi:hypothetical protein